MAMALVPRLALYLRSTSDAVHSSLYNSSAYGAAGHNRGEAAERRFPARTQGRTVGRTLDTCARHCVGLLANSWIIYSSIWVFRKPIFIFVPRVELHNKQRLLLSWEKTLRTEGAL